MTLRPLQITNKPRCRARVRNHWYHQAEFGTGDHQCPFPAHRGGWCKRHDPSRILTSLRKKERRLFKELNQVRALLVEGVAQESATNAVARKEREARDLRDQLASPENPS